MPYLLLGPDDYSKDLFTYSLVNKLRAELVIFKEGDALPLPSELTQTDLFSGSKVFWFKGVMPDFSAGVPDLTLSNNKVVISLTALDKRKKENKELLGNKLFQVSQFNLPHGTELDAWLIKRAKELGGAISSKGAGALAVALGRDSSRETKFGGKVVSVEEVYNLWQAENELKKLISFAKGREVTEQEVRDLVPGIREVDVFDLTNAIADNQKEKALSLMQEFLSLQTGSDEKASIIQLNALLSEQFRNVAVVQSFMGVKVSEDVILEKTGWKSGRLFVVKKIASRFTPKAVLELLNKLAALDEELKTSNTPPKVLLDLIISQLLI